MASFAIGWGVLLAMEYLKPFWTNTHATDSARLNHAGDEGKVFEINDARETTLRSPEQFASPNSAQLQIASVGAAGTSQTGSELESQELSAQSSHPILKDDHTKIFEPSDAHQATQRSVEQSPSPTPTQLYTGSVDTTKASHSDSEEDSKRLSAVSAHLGLQDGHTKIFRPSNAHDTVLHPAGPSASFKYAKSQTACVGAATESSHSDSNDDHKIPHHRSKSCPAGSLSPPLTISSSHCSIDLAMWSNSDGDYSTSSTSASDGKNKEAQGSDWIMIGDFIEHKNKFIGYSKEWHENKLEELQEEHEDVVDELKISHEEEVGNLKRTFKNEKLALQRQRDFQKTRMKAQNEELVEQKNSLDELAKLLQKRNEIIAKHETSIETQARSLHEREETIQRHETVINEQSDLLIQRDREISQLHLRMDSLTDQIALRRPSGPTHPQDWHRIAAQQRSAERTNVLLYDYHEAHMSRINELEQQLQVQTHRAGEAEEQVVQLRNEIERGPWRNDQLIRLNGQQKTALDAADKREADLGGRINRAENRIRQLRTHSRNLEAQKAHSTTSAEVLAALERLHAFCHRNFHTLGQMEGKEAVDNFADWHEDFLASIRTEVEEFEQLREINERLVEEAKEHGEKIRILVNKNTRLETLNQNLDRENTKNEAELFEEEMKSYALEEEVNKLRLDASMTPGLKNLVKELRSLLMHSWVEAAPAQFRNAIVHMKDEVDRVTEDNLDLQRRMEPLQTNFDVFVREKHRYETESKTFDNIWARYAIEFNARVDLAKVNKQLRRRLGEPEAALTAEDDNPPFPNLYARRGDEHGRYELTLEGRDGKFTWPQEFEGLEDGNDLVLWGALQKNEDGSYSKGDGSWWLGDGNPAIPVGPSSAHYPVLQLEE